MNIISNKSFCENALRNVREILDKPELLAIEKAQDILTIMETLTLEKDCAPQKRERSLEELEREIFVNY